MDALGLKFTHMFRQPLPRRLRFERGNQRFEHHRGFTGAGDACHRHEPAARNINVQRLDRMQLAGCHADAAKVEHLRFRHALTDARAHIIGQERRNTTTWIRRHLADRPLRDHMPSFGAGNRSHFDKMVGGLEHAHVMVHDHHGIAVRHQVMHHAEQPIHVRGVQAMDGSSSTYSTPVVRLRTARASCTRWRSPVESVAPARSSAR